MTGSERPPSGDLANDALQRRWAGRLQRLVQIHPSEIRAATRSCLFFFCVLTAYYVIRPIRDDMGVAGGVQNLPWLFTGSLAGMAIANPAFGYIASRLSRPRFVTLGYRFFAANLLLFFVALNVTPDAQAVWTGRVFFVWTAVFNMFVVSMFWSVMTDVFSTSQSKRLFGFIGAGGTVGSITGASITSGLVGIVGAANLLLVSALLLEVAGYAARTLFAEAERRPMLDADHVREPGAVLGGRAWEGITRTATNPYLRGIALHLVLFTVLTTLLYMQQAAIVDSSFTDRVERTRFFANVDLTVNVLVLLTQTFVTSHIIRVFGVSVALAFLPAVSVIGFGILSLAPTVAVLMTFQVIRRSGEFAVARPAREVLFTAARREDRYKAKNFIDTFVYRAGDQIGAWGYGALALLGAGASGTAGAGVVLAIVAVVVAFWLGGRQRAESEQRQAEQASTSASVPGHVVTPPRRTA